MYWYLTGRFRGDKTMKRYNNLYEKIYNIDNIRLAHKRAQLGKKHYKEVMRFNRNENFYIEKIHQMLKSKTFVNSQYEIFIKNDKGKEREIYKLPYFPDRVIHHAIMQVLEPIWFKTLISDTYQSIRGRGVHKAKKKIERIIRKDKPVYCLQLDVQKFYPSINNDILKQIIRKKIKCKDTLTLLDEIIDSTKGVPIGNYMSQYFGNLYLTYFDHWVKEKLGVKHYFRYCDDIVILHDDKEYLHDVFNTIKEYLDKELKLSIKGNYQVYQVNKRGVDFLGFRFFHQYTMIRNKIKKNMVKTFRDITNNHENFGDRQLKGKVAAYNGWSIITDSFNLWNTISTYKLRMIFANRRINNKILIRN
jgi:hypothetical protein